MFVPATYATRDVEELPVQSSVRSLVLVKDTGAATTGDIKSSKIVGSRMRATPFLISKPGYDCPPDETSSVSDDQSDDQKRDRESVGGDLEERRAKNRLSAHQSRLRKRSQLKYLQNQVLELSDENSKLSSSNQDLISQLASTRAENASLRMMQQETMRIATALRLAQSGLLDGGNVAPLSFPPF